MFVCSMHGTPSSKSLPTSQTCLPICIFTRWAMPTTPGRQAGQGCPCPRLTNGNLSRKAGSISLRMGAEALLGPGTGLRLLEAGLPATKPVGGPRCPQSPVWENPDHPERAPAGLLSPGPPTMHGSERRLPGGATTTGQRFAFVPNEQLSLKP